MKEALTIKTLIHELSKFPKECWDYPIEINISGERIPGRDLFFTKFFTKEDILNDLWDEEEITFHLNADEIEDYHNPAMLLEDYIDFENIEERVVQKYKRNKEKKEKKDEQ